MRRIKTTRGTNTTTAKSARKSRAGFCQKESIFSRERLTPVDNIREKIVTLTSICKKRGFIIKSSMKSLTIE
jgi:hypothetical protein